MNQLTGDSNRPVGSNAGSSENVASQQTNAPEKVLTRIALRLALTEKTATGLGALGFIWATVVLLGRFSSTLDNTDFWLTTIILVIEGTRIFSKSNELEWQHQATWSNEEETAPSSGNFIQYLTAKFCRSSSSDEEDQPPAVQSSNLFSVTQNITKVWYWLQLLSSIACVAFSLYRLITASSGHNETVVTNSVESLIIFYSLILAESSFFITEKVSWEWIIRFGNSLENVNAAYGFGTEGMISTQRFLYDAYLKSINGSVLDSLRMDMVSFAVELLNSNSPNEQLTGARLLQQLSTNDKFSFATLSKIGEEICVIERLVGMLNRRNPNERDLRESAEKILQNVASHKAISLRLAEIPGVLESVVLLLTGMLNSEYPNERELRKSADKILQQVASHKTISLRLAEILDVLKSVVLLLVEMLNNRNPIEQELSPNEQKIRESAAELLQQVANHKAISLRLAEIPSVLESAVSLLVGTLNSRNPNERESRESAAMILQQVASHKAISLRLVEIPDVLESVVALLVGMPYSRNPKERELRESAAKIWQQVASHKTISLRLAEIPDVLELAASLVHTGMIRYAGASDEIRQRENLSNGYNSYNNYKQYNILGLSILNKLSCDPENCGKIGNTRGLLPKIIDFIYVTDFFPNPNYLRDHITLVSESLKLVKKLVSSTGKIGVTLRKEISDIVFTMSKIRNLLKDGVGHPEFQLKGIKILTKLGLEDDATEKIGRTGGLLKELLNLFFMTEAETVDKSNLRDAAGDAIAMLTLGSKNNCHRVRRLKDVIDMLVNALKEEALRINTARILRNLLIYTDAEDAYFNYTVLRVVETAPMVQQTIIYSGGSYELREAMTGLALHVFKYMKHEEFNSMLEIDERFGNKLAFSLVVMLHEHRFPSIRVPSIRRFAIELAIWMMKERKQNVATFRELNITEVLEGVIESTTDVENFQLFSGTFGIRRHDKSLQDLAEEALGLVA